MPTLKASRHGVAKIKQARNEKGWGWSMEEDDSCLLQASALLEPDTHWFPGGPYAIGISEPTWKRFLAGKHPINAAAFKAYCKVLGLNWEEVVDRTSPAIANTHQDWEEEIDVGVFFGRTTELALLDPWIVTERCRLVALLGMGGIGKTALGVKLAKQIQGAFESLIWRSLRNAPPVQEILADLIEFLSDGRDTNLAKTVNGQVSQLIEHLRTKRCLLLLDDVETVLDSGKLAGQYRDGYQDYGKLIKRVGEERHQSCLVLISREKPIEIAALAGAALSVRSMKLKGLPSQDAKKLLEAIGFSNLPPGWEELIQRYRGNPLALKIMANTIQEIFNGNIPQFLEQTTFFIGDILPSLLRQQFERLSSLEREVMYWLSLEDQSISLTELKSDMRFSVSSSTELIAALASLKRRSLLEEETGVEGREGFFTIQPVLRKYVTNQLIEQVAQDIVDLIETQSINKLGLLRGLNLVQEQEPGNVQESQIHLSLMRILEKLSMILTSANSLHKQLNEVLLILNEKSPQIIGYAQSNILNLLQVIEN